MPSPYRQADAPTMAAWREYHALAKTEREIAKRRRELRTQLLSAFGTGSKLSAPSGSVLVLTRVHVEAATIERAAYTQTRFTTQES